MPKIAYTKKNGMASDLRFVPDTESLNPGEILFGSGDRLPELSALHEAAIGVDIAKSEALAEIDAAGEAARLRYITPGSGQALTYLQKEADARAYAGAGYPAAQLAAYPWINAEKTAMGQTGREAADTIIATADGWRAVAVGIEAARMAAKKAVSDALAVEEVATVKESALAAIEAL